jgi:hypothetical protein
MAYIGVSPSNGVRRKHTYTATAAQTSFSGAGAEGITLGYLDSNYVDVYQNGVKLSEADYVSTSGTAIVLATGATASDMIEVVVYDVFSVADTVSKSAGGTFDGNVTMAGTLGVAGKITADAGIDIDNINIDGTTIALSSGDLTLDVAGNIFLDADGSLVVLRDGGTEYLRFGNVSSDAVMQSLVQDKDIIFKGNDNGAVITALTLNMSDGGTAQFNDKIQCNSINTGSSAGTLTMFGGGTNKGGTIEMSGGNNTGSTGSGIVFKTGASTSSPSEKMRIDQTGAVTMPLQPAFSVHKGGTAQSDITANDAFYTITWSGERFDQNADFSSNTFTAPVTGKYFFQLNVRLQQVDTAGGYYILGISTSNEDYRFIFDPDFTADPNYWGISMSVLADMDANDTVTTSILQQTGTAQTDIGGSPEYTFFSGFLAC